MKDLAPMPAHETGIFSSDGDLVARLRAACPAWTFVSEPAKREACRLAVVDAGE
jgi:hypothetical protein